MQNRDGSRSPASRQPGCPKLVSDFRVRNNMSLKSDHSVTHCDVDGRATGKVSFASTAPLSLQLLSFLLHLCLCSEMLKWQSTSGVVELPFAFKMKQFRRHFGPLFFAPYQSTRHTHLASVARLSVSVVTFCNGDWLEEEEEQVEG